MYHEKKKKKKDNLFCLDALQILTKKYKYIYISSFFYIRFKPILPPKELYPSTPSISGVVNQSMPMAAIFLRNKFIGWFSFIQSFHYFLTVSDEQLTLLKNNLVNNPNNFLDQSPLFKIILCLIGLLVCYLNLIFPQNFDSKKN